MFKNRLYLKLDPKWSPEEEFKIFSGLSIDNDFKQQAKVILLTSAVLWLFSIFF